MPFYEYQCQTCQFETEVMQSINADPLVTCQECGEDKLRRKIFAAGMIFKGNGFYSTEYRGSDYDAAAKKDSEGSSTSSTDTSNSSKESQTSGSNESSSSSADSVSSSNTSTSNSSPKLDA